MRSEVLERINKIVRDEKGRRVSENSTLRDAELDSFGITMLFTALDDEYQYFVKAGYGDDVFKVIPYDTLTISEMIDICVSETTTISSPQ